MAKKNKVFRNEYKEPAFLVPSADLTVELDDTQTIVESSLRIIRNGSHSEPLALDYCKLKIVSIELDGQSVTDYSLNETQLIIGDVPDSFTFKSIVEINPSENLALEGLYKSGDIFCTQNEPEGFRRITFFPDRPDVMSVFNVKIIASKEKYPVLLANGNCVDSGEIDDERHWALWHDPFPKSSYLFALVAGKLGMISKLYKTKNGKNVDCRIYCDPGNEKLCSHALNSLIKAMEWDERRFGLEYDLGTYMIVAVDAFNMGAMENKGLNIFNSKYILASKETATDKDYAAIESVVAHEYFHNWTGNRVTLRDWFQLSLKEGLTVFRDQEFTSDIQSRPVKRIEDANDLRAIQFVEDAGANAHPVRPDSYMEINNFYTVTIYDKGAEVFRMIHTILGEKNFQKGMKRYFKLFDGKAVTCDDFMQTMESACETDLTQLSLWLSQSGTPRISVSQRYDDTNKRFHLTLTQDMPAGKEVMYIPIAAGLIDENGSDMPLDEQGSQTVILTLKEKQQDFLFEHITDRPRLSINRNFSAPVIIDYNRSLDELLFLFANDSDPFNRWDAGQSAAKEIEKQYAEDFIRGRESILPPHLTAACENLIKSTDTDDSFKALALDLPSEEVLAQEYDIINFDALHAARQNLKRDIGIKLENAFYDLFISAIKDKNDSSAKRKIALRSLSYLAATGKQEYRRLCLDTYFNAGEMTMKIGSLAVLADSASQEAGEALDEFYNKWKNDRNVIVKWFAVQASSPLGRLERILELEKNAAFDIRIPNLVRSLTGAFGQNMTRFHDISGNGYSYMAERIIEIDSFNPSISSSLARSFKLYRKTDPARKPLIKKQLERILEAKNLSKNTHELVENILNYG
ncbi:MAG: aminopeptidase N [Leptospirales bacterium]|nr:aminopeptidase N [Leptospirales bacterium]